MNNMMLTFNSWVQFLLPICFVAMLIKPLGAYMARVYSNQFVMLEHIFGPVEEIFYKIARIDPMKEMGWQEYAFALILASFGSFLLLFLILTHQAQLPFNPEHFPNLNDSLAFNIAASFITNTNWQSYAGETTLSYFSQMSGLGVQNFASAGIGMCVIIALIRGIIRKKSQFIGNFWVDWLRGCLYILLPLSILLAMLLGSQGVIQNLKPYLQITMLESVQNSEGNAISTQTIPGGPVASQVAIKQLGSNGGGFFNANSAHPFENPTPLSNLLSIIAILLIPTALCYTFGVLINDTRQGWMLLFTMTIIFIPLTWMCIEREQVGNQLLSSMPISQVQSTLPPIQSGGNMEGKELRFGILNSALWSAATTATSNGSTNSSLDSYAPYGGMVPMMFLMLGEVIYGGVGSGLYGMLIYVLITVFIAGLMVGKTPEYLGKKIEAFDIKMASLTVLITIFVALFGCAIAVLTIPGRAGVFNPGAQGFSEILYALLSCAMNNGSSFAGINANTPFYNTLLGIIMLVSRYWIIIPVLAIAGSLAQKNNIPTTSSTLVTHSPLFVALLIAIILLIGLLTYVPALTLGPINENFYMTISNHE